MPSKNSRLQQWLHYRVRVTLRDSRVMVGSLMAFDRHVNLVLSDCDEYRKIKIKSVNEDGKKTSQEKEIKRTLGFVLIRGENVVSFQPEAPPPAQPKKPGDGPIPGPGRGIPAGRGMPMGGPMMGMGMSAPAGLAGPVGGVGGPAPAHLMAPGGRGMPPMPNGTSIPMMRPMMMPNQQPQG